MIKGLIVILTIFLAGFAFIEANNTYFHEEAHKAIAEKFGCLNSTITYNMYGVNGGSFNCTKYAPNTDYVKMSELHSLNEIETYNNQYISMSIMFSSLMICLLLSLILYEVRGR